MQTRIAVEKKAEQTPSGGRNNQLQNRAFSMRPTSGRPNVRTTEYTKMIQIVLTDPDSVTHEEFLLFQSAIGYRKAVALIEEGRRRKRQREAQPVRLEKEDGKDIASKEVGAGIPDNLKSGLEKLSGTNLSEVSVHKNSDKPQQVGALAYTQGNDIHIAPGQEKHLPHEGWHAVQQKQGRVEPTLQMKTGAFVNDDEGLEKEADIMGSKAAKKGSQSSTVQLQKSSQIQPKQNKGNVIQRITQDEAMALSKQNSNKQSKNGIMVTEKSNQETGSVVDAVQTALDIVGFIPGVGDVADGVNTGICIVRKDWLGAVFSAIALIPVLGSAIAGPMKTIAKAAGNTKLVQKAIELLLKLLGGIKKVVSKLDDLLKALKGILRRLPDLIDLFADSKAVRWLIGKKKVKVIRSFVKSIKSGIETLCKRADDVFTSIKKRFTKGTGKAVPQGLTGEQFGNASKLIRQNVGNISDDIVVQGSRAGGTAKATSDIDFAIRVSPEEFDTLVKQRFGTPNVDSAKERTMLNAIDTGKIQSGEAGLRNLRKQLQEELGMEVDISIIKSVGTFDNGPTINLPK